MQPFRGIEVLTLMPFFVTCKVVKYISMRNSFKSLLVALFSVASFATTSHAQALMYEMGTVTDVVYECGTDALFTDNNLDPSGTGGAQNPYTCENGTITFCPSVDGDAVQLQFAVFDLQTNANPNNHDVLYVYDGPDTNAPLVGAGTGNSFQGISYTASFNNPSGCLTFQFVCNNGATGGNIGWAAYFDCVTPCSYPESGVELVSPEPFEDLPEGVVSVGLCPGEDVTFSAATSFGNDGFALDSLIWNWGDGEVETTAVSDGLNVSHSYDTPGEYIVTLTVMDENQCNSTNLQPQQVLVSTIPIFNAEFTSPLCVGSPGYVNGNPVQSVTWTALPPVAVSEEEPLPDDTGIPFVSDLFIDFFDQGQVLEDCDDIEFITANIEHSFVGDLTFWVTCPDGTEVILMENGPSGAADPNGCTPNDVNGNNLGIAAEPFEGWDYSWSMDAEWVLDDADNPDVADPIPSDTYLPCGDLCDFVGCPLNGVWSFTVFDQWGGDDGMLYWWEIGFNPEIVPGVTTFTPEIGLEADSSYWMVNPGDPGVVDISLDDNYVDLLYDQTGEYSYTYEVTNNFGCTWDTTVNITVIEGPQNNVSAGFDQVYCQDPVQLEGSLVNLGASTCAASSGTFNHCYGNNQTESFTYCPDVLGDGTLMALEFNSGELDQWSNDVITVYDGSDNSAPVLGTITGNDDVAGQVFNATNADGCLTVEFTSDAWTSCQDGWIQEIEWCVSCGFTSCGFDWEWQPGESLNDPTSETPTVTDFDGGTTQYVLFLNPIGYENCAATDTVLVLPGIDYSFNEQQPSCLQNDGVLVVELNELVADGPFYIDLIQNAASIQSETFDGSDFVVNDLEPGTYTLQISDDNGCVYNEAVQMNAPAPMTIDVSGDVVICQTASTLLEGSSDQDPAGLWTYYWINGLTGDTASTPDGSYVASPLSSTVYTVFAEDPNGCPTADELINVNVLGELTVDLSATEFICSGEEAQLDASGSFGGSGNGFTFSWEWEGNPLPELSGTQVQHLPPSTGEYCVLLHDDCETPPGTACVEVTIETPLQVDFVADTTVACANGAFAFTNLVDPALISTSLWDFGDDSYAAELNTVHIYEQPGFYDVKLLVQSLAGGCEYEGVKEAYINVYPLPEVGFYANPQPARVPNTTITFDGVQSDNVVSWLWTFNTFSPLGFAIEEDPVYTFPYDVGGFYPVTLEVVDVFGCTNSVTREIEIRDMFNLYIPTSFTPNNDGTNDAFFVQGSDINPEKFEFQIFNRWGEVVFETNDITEPWIGQAANESGEYYVPNGTYMYRVEVHSASEEAVRKEVYGYVMLIR